MVRRFLYGLIALSVVMFGVAFVVVAASDDQGAWGTVLGVSIMVFVMAIVAVQFAGQGLGRAEGPNGHPEYEVRHRETVPQVLIGRLSSGETLPVRVNPHKPSDFIVEWERA